MMKKLATSLALFLAVMPAALADDPEPQKAVWRAAMRGEAALTALLATGVSVNIADRDGETALMEAADKGQPEVVKLLIKHGANVNAADEDGETALRNAEEERHYDTARVLREAGTTR